MHLNNSICKSREEREEKREEEKKLSLCSNPINKLREHEAGNAGLG